MLEIGEIFQLRWLTLACKMLHSYVFPHYLASTLANLNTILDASEYSISVSNYLKSKRVMVKQFTQLIPKDSEVQNIYFISIFIFLW